MQLLLADGLAVTDPDTTQLIGISLSNAERLIRIVNDILDMSKIEAGEMVVDPTPVSVAPILGDSVRSVEAFARGSGVELRVSMPSGLPTVNIDPDRTVQILVNLLSNAVKHAPAGTSVDVVARVMPDGVAIDIRDHGPGIPAGKIKLIFEPFTQLDGSDTRRIAGTGLGLTIARALAERQGGSITVASLEGDGATFTLTLPRSRP
jgi:signal transduction histidine kinase